MTEIDNSITYEESDDDVLMEWLRETYGFFLGEKLLKYVAFGASLNLYGEELEISINQSREDFGCHWNTALKGLLLTFLLQRLTPQIQLNIPLEKESIRGGFQFTISSKPGFADILSVLSREDALLIRIYLMKGLLNKRLIIDDLSSQDVDVIGEMIRQNLIDANSDNTLDLRTSGLQRALKIISSLNAGGLYSPKTLEDVCEYFRKEDETQPSIPEWDKALLPEEKYTSSGTVIPDLEEKSVPIIGEHTYEIGTESWGKIHPEPQSGTSQEIKLSGTKQYPTQVGVYIW